MENILQTFYLSNTLPILKVLTLVIKWYVIQVWLIFTNFLYLSQLSLDDIPLPHLKFSRRLKCIP